MNRTKRGYQVVMADLDVTSMAGKASLIRGGRLFPQNGCRRKCSTSEHDTSDIFPDGNGVIYFSSYQFLRLPFNSCNAL